MGTGRRSPASRDHTQRRSDVGPAAIERLCEEALRPGFRAVRVNPVHGAVLLPSWLVDLCWWRRLGFPLRANLPEALALKAVRAVA